MLASLRLRCQSTHGKAGTSPLTKHARQGLLLSLAGNFLSTDLNDGKELFCRGGAVGFQEDAGFFVEKIGRCGGEGCAELNEVAGALAREQEMGAASAVVVEEIDLVAVNGEVSGETVAMDEAGVVEAADGGGGGLKDVAAGIVGGRWVLEDVPDEHAGDLASCEDLGFPAELGENRFGAEEPRVAEFLVKADESERLAAAEEIAQKMPESP